MKSFFSNVRPRTLGAFSGIIGSAISMTYAHHAGRDPLSLKTLAASMALTVVLAATLGVISTIVTRPRAAMS